MRRLSLFLICLGLSSGAGVATAAECRLDTLTQQLWRGPLQELLADDLWVNDAYDAAHALLVPLHAAYRTPPGDEQPFEAFMARALAHSDQLATPGSLNRWQFLYLVTQYLSLRDASGQWTETDQRWADLIATEAQELWEERPVKWYNGQTFGNMRDLLRWKLETPAERLDKRYHGIVWDLEWYVMAASSDLYALHRDNSFGELYRMSIAPTLRDVLTRYLPVQPDGTVLYRPGVWSDYPDFAYAGYAQAPAPGDPPKPNPNVTLDSSHASRFGLGGIVGGPDRSVPAGKEPPGHPALRAGADVYPAHLQPTRQHILCPLSQLHGRQQYGLPLELRHRRTGQRLPPLRAVGHAVSGLVGTAGDAGNHAHLPQDGRRVSAARRCPQNLRRPQHDAPAPPTAGLACSLQRWHCGAEHPAGGGRLPGEITPARRKGSGP
ncbi:hypothetical protein [Deinococcus radiophilus]|uniref:hypothetical protein n=1 Tax=Deinococcus radiophilus TaxID=32062 RepID=UPI00361B3008